MIVDIPEVGEDTWFSFKINYGGRVLTCTMYWCEETQNLYDKLAAQLVTDAQNDPIITSDGAYIRYYDIMEYYSVNDPITGVDKYAQWYGEHRDSLTSSLRAIPYDYALQRTVIERSSLYYGINRSMARIKEMCTWTFTIHDRDDVITGTVRPGGIYTKENDWTLYIRSEFRTDIGRRELSFVTMEIV